METLTLVSLFAIRVALPLVVLFGASALLRAWDARRSDD